MQGHPRSREPTTRGASPPLHSYVPQLLSAQMTQSMMTQFFSPSTEAPIIPTVIPEVSPAAVAESPPRRLVLRRSARRSGRGSKFSGCKREPKAASKKKKRSKNTAGTRKVTSTAFSRPGTDSEDEEEEEKEEEGPELDLVGGGEGEDKDEDSVSENDLLDTQAAVGDPLSGADTLTDEPSSEEEAAEATPSVDDAAEDDPDDDDDSRSGRN
jgi:hypothetical protein